MNGNIRLVTVKIVQNSNDFGLLHKPRDYFASPIKVAEITGLIILSCKFRSKDHFYPKSQCQEVTEKIPNVLHTRMQEYYIRLSIEILEKP